MPETRFVRTSSRIENTRCQCVTVTFFNSGELTASSLKTFGQQLLAARQSMSAEEQSLRSSDPNLR